MVSTHRRGGRRLAQCDFHLVPQAQRDQAADRLDRYSVQVHLLRGLERQAFEARHAQKLPHQPCHAVGVVTQRFHIRLFLHIQPCRQHG